jgi:stage II sporulation protein D
MTNCSRAAALGSIRSNGLTAVSLPPSPTDTAIVRKHLHPIGIFAAVLAAACAHRPSLPRHPAGETVRIKVTEGTTESVREVPLEDYVAIAALSELAPTAADRPASEAMFEIQSIVARTYALAHRGRHGREGFDLCSTTHCQIYEPGRLATSRSTSIALEAAKRTAGVILSYHGTPADAVYHADCGGWTSAAADVWKGPSLPYLPAQPDRDDAKDAHARWQYAVDREALQRALGADPRTHVEGTLAAITVLSRDQSGRAQQVLLRANHALIVRATDLREVLTAAFGVRAVRSTLFEVVVDGRRFVFSGSGFGHGVGLCQVGALARLSAGESTGAVLQHYYPGTVLSKGGFGRQASGFRYFLGMARLDAAP